MTYQNNKAYFIGIMWFIVSLFISNANDIIVKYVGDTMHPMQIAFFRFLFGTLSLLPVMLYCGLESFKTKRKYMHLSRGVLLFVGISIWCYGLGTVPITTATIITFTIPLFVLMLARIILKERVSMKLWAVTLAGFAGILVVYNPFATSFNMFAVVMLASSIMFALLDIINKKYSKSESMLSMLFYSALVTTVLSLYPAYVNWGPVEFYQIALLAILGVFSNLILFFLLKAFQLVNASAVAPYRYLELVLSGFFGYAIFAEIPEFTTYIGICIVVPSTLYVAYNESKKASA